MKGALPTDDGSVSRRPGGAGLKTHRGLRLIAFALTAVAVAAAFRLHNPTVCDPDSFYHFRHAALYGENGVLMRDFPWIAYSILNRFSSDLAYGFHILLVPFTLLRDPVLGLRLAAVFEITVLLLLLYLVMRRHKVTYDFAWPFLVTFAAPPIMFLLLMTRPHTITMGLSVLLLSLMASGGTWGVLLTSMAIAFIHLNFFWVIPLVVVVSAGVGLFTERRLEWRKAVAALVGLSLGWLLRPNPIGAARIEYVQAVMHAVQRQKGGLLFGLEWLPMPPEQMLSTYSMFIVIWLTLTAVFVVSALTRRTDVTPSTRTLLWSSLLLSLLFLAVTLLNTKRGLVLWVAFAGVFSAVAFTSVLDPRKPRQLLGREARMILALWIAGLSVFLVGRAAVDHFVLQRGFNLPPDRMKPAATWLKEHAAPGEIVYNVTWDIFPELFFWNPQNRYVSGLDPIFQYAYDRDLYWKQHHLEAMEGTEYTTGSPDYKTGRLEDTYTVLRRDFKASYIVVETRLHEGLYEYLRGDPRFVPRYQDENVAIYQLGAGTPEREGA